ncbi:MAG: D-alanine--D-alanine ligase [Ignavibacteria bacterium]|jgi:D-alanine-D-alanine ligase|nr:D-alanine--D-alanine ligase [Ignavibacteria bacterium]
MKIALLTGGISSEREVALSSGRGVLNALRKLGHDVTVIDPIYGSNFQGEDVIFSDKVSREYPSLEKLRKMQSENSRNLIECINSEIFDDIDIAFLALHGKFGEDGKIQTLLSLRGVKYTGSGIESSCIAMDKDFSKTVFMHNRIPTPNWITLGKDNGHNNPEIYSVLGRKLVVKPSDEGSTVGLRIVDNSEELNDAIEYGFSYTSKVLVEEYIKGRELTVSILGNEALPVIEIKPKEGFYDYEHKYTKGMTEYICPAEIPVEISDEAKKYALAAYNSLGCEVYARVDFLMTDSGNLFCLEVNTLPGMTELSLVPKAAQAVGIEFNDLIDRIINLSLKKYV